MKELSTKKARLIAAAIAAGFAANMAFAVPAEAKSADAAADATVESQIATLQQRLAELEDQLKAVKASEKATKAQLKKESKKNNNGRIVWSGSTKSGYWADSDHKSKFKAEFKLEGKAKLGDGYQVQMGLKFKSTTENAYNTVDPQKGKIKSKDGYEKNKIKLNYANVSKRFGDKANIVIGTQKAEVGLGLWLAKAGTNQILGEYNFTPKDVFRASYGYDSGDYLADTTQTKTRLLKFFEYRHDFDKNSFAGIYYGTQQPDKYLGIYGSTPMFGKFWIDGEFVRNSNTDRPLLGTSGEGYGYEYIGSKDATKGYVINLNYGKAKKKGSWGFQLQYLNVDQNLFMTDDYSDLDDYIDADGFKGWGTTVSYALSDRVKLELINYWGNTKSNSANLNEDGKALKNHKKNSVYLKLTTKF